METLNSLMTIVDCRPWAMNNYLNVPTILNQDEKGQARDEGSAAAASASASASIRMVNWNAVPGLMPNAILERHFSTCKTMKHKILFYSCAVCANRNRYNLERFCLCSNKFENCSPCPGPDPGHPYTARPAGAAWQPSWSCVLCVTPNIHAIFVTHSQFSH